MSDDRSEYARGHRQGEISQELREHAEHLARINGSMERVAVKLAEVSGQLAKLLQAIARIDQAMTADKETVRQTAAALRDQADVASTRDTARWTPLNRALVIVTTLVGAGGLVYLFIGPHP